MILDSILEIPCPSQAGALLQRNYLARSIDEMIPITSAGIREVLIIWRTLILICPVVHPILGSWPFVCNYVTVHLTAACLVLCQQPNKQNSMIQDLSHKLI